jgi:uncharacterized protein YdeI (YjbR/CyaY-like superfamily)
MTDPRIDAYIEKAAPFAQPIMIKLRELIHKACPEVVETIKWGMPSFEYMGPLCSFAAFKQHCAFGFWKTTLLSDPGKYLKERSAQGGDAMGNFGRMTSVKDIPPVKVMVDFIHQSMQLNADGVKTEKKKAAPKKAIPVPAELQKALNKNSKAKFYFEKFSPSQQKDYNVWIADAKTNATRNKRIADAIEWISEGKIRNWKYAKKKP